jgi:hypothetical protein
VAAVYVHACLQARLQHKSSELQGLSGREEELKERLNDLNAFVEVSPLTGFVCVCVLLVWSNTEAVMFDRRG